MVSELSAIHMSSLVCLHKWPVMRKAYSRHDLILHDLQCLHCLLPHLSKTDGDSVFYNCTQVLHLPLHLINMSLLNYIFQIAFFVN